MSKYGICCALVLMGILSEAKAQGWREIVPLRSTCEDVKRILNLSKCEPSTVELEDVNVFVVFSAGACKSEWDVPSGIVLTLDVWPRKDLTFTDLNIDKTKYSKTISRKMPDTMRLMNIEDGISIDLYEDGRIRHISYGPTAKDQHLHCGSSLGRETGSIKFDEYGFIPFEEERSRLDGFAKTLSGWSGARGYVIVYPGDKMALEQAQTRANRAASYLMQKAGLKDRIVTVIGGNREEPSVELFITVQNGSPPILTPPRDSRPLRR